MLDKIKNNELIEPFIKALLAEMGLDEYASVFDTAIELEWHAPRIDGFEFLFLFLQATSEQINRAATRVLSSLASD